MRVTEVPHGRFIDIDPLNPRLIVQIVIAISVPREGVERIKIIERDDRHAQKPLAELPGRANVELL